jgi:type IV secretory pathway TraG/TraD family ATPase VirD4
MSKAIGDEQVRRTNESTNAEGQTTRSEQIAQQRTVMPAELQNLPDLVGILNIAGPLPAGWVTIPVSNLQRKTEGFQIVRS